MTTLEIMKRAKAAWPSLLNTDSDLRVKALSFMAEALVDNTEAILVA